MGIVICKYFAPVMYVTCVYYALHYAIHSKIHKKLSSLYVMVKLFLIDRFETENGILAEESGRIENLAASEDGLRSKGFYQYTGDDGLLYRVDYVADNNGFIPEVYYCASLNTRITTNIIIYFMLKGDHIPKTPPEILKLLDYLAAHPENNKNAI